MMPKTKAERRDAIDDMRSMIEEIDADLDGAKDELADALEALKELRNRIETLREQKAWRVSAVKFLRSQK